MDTSESFRALRRAKPWATTAAVDAVRAQVMDVEAPMATRRRVWPSAAAASLVALALVAAVIVGSRGPAAEDATAAVRHAASVTAASAERSGTAVVTITHEGSHWAGSTIRWHGRDVAVFQNGRGSRAGSRLLVVDGMMYGVEPERGWVELGPPESVDPGSGTTAAEYLGAVREDVGGVTLRRITESMTAATTRDDEGSTVYAGKVTGNLLARETGLKEGRAIRVLPFGYVAHDLRTLVNVAITVGADEVIRRLDVMWGSWSYTVAYRDLATTPALVAPRNAEPLRRGPA